MTAENVGVNDCDKHLIRFDIDFMEILTLHHGNNKSMNLVEYMAPKQSIAIKLISNRLF